MSNVYRMPDPELSAQDKKLQALEAALRVSERANLALEKKQRLLDGEVKAWAEAQARGVERRKAWANFGSWVYLVTRSFLSSMGLAGLLIALVAPNAQAVDRGMTIVVIATGWITCACAYRSIKESRR